MEWDIDNYMPKKCLIEENGEDIEWIVLGITKQFGKLLVYNPYTNEKRELDKWVEISKLKRK
jgi:hypothetical protein